MQKLAFDINRPYPQTPEILNTFERSLEKYLGSHPKLIEEYRIFLGIREK